MWAQVDNNSVIRTFTHPTPISIGDNNYPAEIFNLWPEVDLNALDIWEVVEDKTNYKDDGYYQNTAFTYTYNAGTGKVDKTWGSATARNLADLKNNKKTIIDDLCNSTLAPSDWRVTKQEETGSAMDSGWKTYRASVRTKCNSMQAQIDGAADVDALIVLYTYTGDPSTRPLGEFPVKE